MSADDWYECPFCKEKEKKIREEQYGKVPYEKFKEMLEEVEVKHPEYDDQSETIRCDYEQWLDEHGNWRFKGGMHCDLCGREWDADVTIKPKVNG